MSGATRQRPAGHVSTFAPGDWRPDGFRLGAAGCVLAGAAGLLVLAPGVLRWLGLLLVADVVVTLLPWRVPRAGRSLPSLWSETLAYQLAPVGALALVVAGHPGWLAGPSHAAWYLAGALLGAALVWAGGMNLRMLVAGHLAFLAGPDRPGHAAALASSALVAAVCEEALFRGVVLEAVDTSWVLALLAALAFVARHHVPPGAAWRRSRRSLATQVAAAAGLLALTAASGSLLPAIVAHLVNNAPAAVLHVQRARIGATQ